MVGDWWLVIGGWCLVIGGWWLVVGGWWLISQPTLPSTVSSTSENEQRRSIR